MLTLDYASDFYKEDFQLIVDMDEHETNAIRKEMAPWLRANNVTINYGSTKQGVFGFTLFFMVNIPHKSDVSASIANLQASPTFKKEECMLGWWKRNQKLLSLFRANFYETTDHAFGAIYKHEKSSNIAATIWEWQEKINGAYIEEDIYI